MELLISRILLYSCCVVLMVVPLYFIAHRVYKDGAFGRLALALITFCSTGMLMEGVLGPTLWHESANPDVLRRFALGLIVGFTLFLVWHLIRWHRRVLRPASDPLPSQRERDGSFALRSIK